MWSSYLPKLPDQANKDKISANVLKWPILFNLVSFFLTSLLKKLLHVRGQEFNKGNVKQRGEAGQEPLEWRIGALLDSEHRQISKPAQKWATCGWKQHGKMVWAARCHSLPLHYKKELSPPLAFHLHAFSREQLRYPCQVTHSSV